MTGTPDLLVTGGTVVTAGGSRRADIAVAGGSIAAIEADLSGLAAGAGRVVEATGMLVLPGVVDVHTHTRVASDGEPDRFFQDSVAAAFGGTTTFLSFNNPGTGSSSAAERSLRTGLAEWRAATDGDSAIDHGLSLAISGHCDDPLGELRGTIEAGVATSKAFMVFDFRLGDQALFDAMRLMGEAGGMLQVHCEDPVLLDAGVAAALARGDTGPRFHATSRPLVRRGGRHGPGAGLRAGDRLAGPRRPPVVRGRARRGPPRQGGRGAGDRRDLSALPRADRRLLRGGRPDPLRLLRDLATDPLGGRPRRAVGGPG